MSRISNNKLIAALQHRRGALADQIHDIDNVISNLQQRKRVSNPSPKSRLLMIAIDRAEHMSVTEALEAAKAYGFTDWSRDAMRRQLDYYVQWGYLERVHSGRGSKMPTLYGLTDLGRACIAMPSLSVVAT